MSKWPEIPYERWQASGTSLHMWLQIVGKFRVALTPWMNHAWQATTYVTARGLTSSLIPGPEESYCTDFDFIDHQLVISATNGAVEKIPLEPQSVAEFHQRFIDTLDRIGAPSDFHGAPNEVEDAVPFAQQTEAGAYNAQAVQDFWRALVAIDGVFKTFRTGFLGKSSPVHLFWGSMDLAVTRFSGRVAPVHPGGMPNLPDEITREAYSHEVSSAGFWAGGNGLDEAAFYSYAYPTPDDFGAVPVTTDGAYYHDKLGEFILPYESVRTAADPDAALLSFLKETYVAAADTAHWDRQALECAIGKPGQPRPLDVEEVIL